MEKKNLLLTCLILFSWSIIMTNAQKPSIAWASQGVATDANYISDLEYAGYHVHAVNDYWINLSAAQALVLDTFDLVIVSRNNNSANFGEGGTVTANWASVTTPVLNLSNYVNRNNRFQLLNTGDPGGIVDKYMIAEVTDHAIFTNTVLNTNDSTLLLTDTQYEANPFTDAGTGTIIATDPVNGYITIGEWDAGTACYTGGVVPAGKRMYVGTPTSYEYTPAGKTLFLDAVEYLITGSVSNKLPTDISISNNSIAENLPIGSKIGTLSAVDPQNDIDSFRIVYGVESHNRFIIEGDTLYSADEFDYETDPSLLVRIRVVDLAGNIYEETITINIADVDESPTDISISNNTIVENSVIGTRIGTLSALDPQNDIDSFRLVTGADDNDSFVVIGDTLYAAVEFDYETTTSLSVRVEVVDLAENVYEEVLAINVVNVAENPTDITISNSDILEDEAIGTKIGTLSAIDPESDIASFSLVSGTGDTDNGNFAIDGDTLYSAVVFDYDLVQSQSIRIEVTDDQSNTYQEILTITIRENTAVPTDISISDNEILEREAIGTAVGTLSAFDTQDDIDFFALVAGTGDTDNASFSIDGDTLYSAVVFDYEAKSSLSVRIEVTDDAGNTFQKALNINVIDVDEEPTDIILSSTEIAENLVVGTEVGTLTAVDPQNDITSYELVAGTGDTDNGSFTIVDDKLNTAVVFDYETAQAFSVRIKVTDIDGNTFAKEFVISILNVDEDPTDINLSANEITENVAIGTEVGTLTAVDPQNDIASYSLVAGTGDTDNTSFTIVDDKLNTAVVLDYESTQSLSVRIQVTDSGGNAFAKEFTINVLDVAETPTGISLSNASITENESVGTEVGTLSAIDPQDDIAAYALVAGTGDADNASFTIDGDKLNTAVVFDYESEDFLSVRIQVTDGEGNSFEKAFVISVLDDVADNNLTMDTIYYGIYSENPMITEELVLDGDSNRIANVSAFDITEPTSDPYEGSKSLSCAYNAADSWAMMQLIAKQGTNVSAFASGYYYITMRTTSTESFHLRITDGTNKPKIDFVNGADPYGFKRDGQWHTLRIPVADWLALNPSLDMSAITEFLVLRSGAADGSGFSGTSADMTIEFDDIYLFALSAPSSSTTGINSEKRLSVYPNPAKDYLIVNDLESFEGSIYSITGEKVKDIHQNIVRIDISDLKNGMYIISMYSEGKQYVTKFIKN